MFPIQIQQKAIQYTPVFHFLLYLWRPLPKGTVLRVKYLLQGKQMNPPPPWPNPHFCWVFGDARVSREYRLILFFLFWKDWPHLTQFMLLNSSVSFHKVAAKLGQQHARQTAECYFHFLKANGECANVKRRKHEADFDNHLFPLSPRNMKVKICAVSSLSVFLSICVWFIVAIVPGNKLCAFSRTMS